MAVRPVSKWEVRRSKEEYSVLGIVPGPARWRTPARKLPGRQRGQASADDEGDIPSQNHRISNLAQWVGSEFGLNAFRKSGSAGWDAAGTYAPARTRAGAYRRLGTKTTARRSPIRQEIPRHSNRITLDI